MPEAYRLDVMLSLHNELAHPTAELVFSELKTRYYWKSMGTDIYAHVKKCKECQFSKHQNIHTNTPLSQRTPATEPFAEWFIDCGDVVRSESGHQHFMVAVDRYSQLVELVALKSQTAQELATAIYSNIYCRYGVGNITTDRASSFTSELMAHMNKLFHVNHKLTTPQHSRSNGLAENTIRRVKDAIRIQCRTGNISQWDKQLPLISMAFRTMPSTVTGLTPYEIIHGKKMVTTYDYAISHVPNNLSMDVYSYLDNLKNRLIKLHEMVQVQRAAAKQKQKEQYDKRHKVSNTVLKEGQLVLLHNPVGQPQHPRKYQTRLSGPYKVLKCLQNNTYMLRNEQTQKELKTPIHMDRLKIYHDPSPNTGDIYQHQNAQEVIRSPDHAAEHDNNTADTNGSQVDNSATNSDQTQHDPEIVKIIKCQYYRKAKIYHVKLTNGKTCWINQSDVPDDMKQEFHTKYNLAGKKKKQYK